MRISTPRLALLLMVLVMVACTPSLTPPKNPTVLSTPELASLPDLITKLIYLEMEGRQSNCVEAYTPYEIRVLVENIGLGRAGPFVVDLNGTQLKVDGGLAAGKFIELHFAGTAPGGRYDVHTDANNQVVEQQEDNNFLSYLAPTPTPPPRCTATPIPTP